MNCEITHGIIILYLKRRVIMWNIVRVGAVKN
ncbi:hypothetical protein Cyrtocomes_01138 [Candidatus Cyrtobacter comes]|uniref:Uncharacterized protein n=1 Tax=Candidatus Cyrtobacter comes TaxID=675776 RepID=A0ABU5LA68_9RICK|nr:hypothetical protein [Candidatus Cyrtobacter comes]